jgi:hypothetical protein
LITFFIVTIDGGAGLQWFLKTLLDLETYGDVAERENPVEIKAIINLVSFS